MGLFSVNYYEFLLKCVLSFNESIANIGYIYIYIYLYIPAAVILANYSFFFSFLRFDRLKFEECLRLRTHFMW